MNFKMRKWLRFLVGSMAIPALSFGAYQFFDPANPPPTLTGTGLYANAALKTSLDTAAKPFEVNSALWSDAAYKKRYIILPPGKHIQWVDETDYFDYPDSSVLVKTFFQILGPAATDTIYWETRFLIKRPDTTENQVWWGFSYRWNKAQTEAYLVDLTKGFDTAFSYVTDIGNTTYKKWRFPSQEQCNSCHRVRYGSPYPTETSPKLEGRGILGFFPAQLKRPVQTQAGMSNQVLQLFAAGVFTGTQPAAASLAKRFIGMHEPIPVGITATQRQELLDTKVRSYLASNCSGCHGDRSKLVGTDARIPPNFDYFDLVQHDVPWEQNPSGYLTDTTPYLDSLNPPTSRAKYQWLVQASGLSSDPNWKMALPAGNPDTMVTKVVYVDHTPGMEKGYPSLSFGLFRQLARRMPAADSAEWYQGLAQAKDEGDAKAIGMLKWIFAAPWGSKPWLDTLKVHNFNLDSVMAGWNGGLYRIDGEQMPPAASYLPDTTALKMMGEWVTNQGIATALRGPVQRAKLTTPLLSANRVLILPGDWKGRVQLLDIQGRAFDLTPLGNGRYALPAHAKAGLHLFRVGDKHFKASLMD